MLWCFDWSQFWFMDDNIFIDCESDDVLLF